MIGLFSGHVQKIGFEKAGHISMMDSTVTLYQVLERSALFRDVRRSFCSATGLSLRLVPAGRGALRLAFPRHKKTFCELLTSSSGACAACLEVHHELLRRLDRKLAPQQVRCFAGLTELAVPVIVGGEPVAILVGGRVFQQKPSRGQFQRLARELQRWGIHGKLSTLKRAYHQVPVVPAKQFQGALRLLAILAKELADSASRSVVSKMPGDSAPIARAKAFVLAHAAERVTLKQAAEQARLSRHYFCKVFKQSTGLTFTEFLARVRVEKVKGLLGDPRLRISEAADRAGFASVSQFNRVFHRFAGISPTVFRARLRKGKH